MDGSEEEGPGGSDTRGGGDLEESVRIVSGASVSVPNLGPEAGRQTVAPSLVFLLWLPCCGRPWDGGDLVLNRE